jgi:hypothetical protein
LQSRQNQFAKWHILRNKSPAYGQRKLTQPDLLGDFMKKVFALIALVAAIAGTFAVASVVTGKPAAVACDTVDCG